MSLFYEDDEEKKLTASETIIMKAVWSEKEDISLMRLMEVLEQQFSRKYARTTVETFLLKLAAKGFVNTYRAGRKSYVHPLKSEEEYRNKLIKDEVNFWFHGKAAGMMSALCGSDGITKEDADEIRSILDEFDD